MMSVKICMVGAGGMANNVHYPSLQSFDDVEFAGICDMDTKRLGNTADKYKIENRYTDYRKMVEEQNPDGVYVIGQPHYMFDIWTWVLNEGLNLYIEKPMGLSIHQARSLAELADKNNCITQVSFQRRTCPMVVNLYEECLKRGPITYAQCQFFKYDGPSLGMRDRMMDDCVHAIDTVRWMCGGEAIEIDAITKKNLTPDINFIISNIHFDTGATGVVQCDWASGRRVFRVEMHAPGVSAEAEHEGMGYLYAEGDYNGIQYDTKEVAGSDENYVYGGFQAKNREFIDAIKGGPKPSSHFGDAIKTMDIAEKILALALVEDHDAFYSIPNLPTFVNDWRKEWKS